jgi:hypothetical protein
LTARSPKPSGSARATLLAARNFLADERARRLPPGQRLFLLAGLVQYANADLRFWPRIGRWAAKAGVSVRTAKEALASLREIDLLEQPLLTVKEVAGKRVYQFDPALPTAHLDKAGADRAPEEGKSRTGEVQDLPSRRADLARVPNEANEWELENEKQRGSSEEIDEDLALALSHFKIVGKRRDAVVEAHKKNPGGLAEAMLTALKKDKPGGYLVALLDAGVHEEPATTRFSRVRDAITGEDPLDGLPRCERCGFQPYTPGVLRDVTVYRDGEPTIRTVCDQCERELKDAV